MRFRDALVSPGGAGNVACNIASLGAEVTLLAIPGRDSGRSVVERELTARGVRVKLIADASRPTVTKTRIVVGGHHVARLDREDNRAIDPSIEDALLDCARSAIGSAEAVVLSDYAKGLLTPRLTRELIRLATAAGVPVVVDPKGTDYSKYDGCFVLTPNLKEAMQAAGPEGEPLANIGRLGCRLLEIVQVASVLIILGEHGMALFERNGTLSRIPGIQRQVYDVTGAGDTVFAVLAVLIAAGCGVADSARVANFAAGIAVTRMGTACINAEELLEGALSWNVAVSEAGV